MLRLVFLAWFEGGDSLGPETSPDFFSFLLGLEILKMAKLLLLYPLLPGE